eukprot:TRINITY_DN6929_c0_g1_i2.p1 TRINITY_DN6929_c0_g1~~TRINITY_DN6929_c0_g1_i2.p1  ORF type:complete len:268 (+),score=70.77 TRINITY_DN6929_c0_g1_i2:46-849(+)
MDPDRISMSLLNKAYEAQCMKIQHNNITDKMNNVNLNQEMHMSSEDRLFMAPAPVRPQSAPAMTVIGGKLVPSNNKPFPLNGQQLQMQLDELTSAMSDIVVHEDTMEMPCNPAYNQYIHERCCNGGAPQDSNPFSQTEKRRDPVYLSMAAHVTTTSPQDDNALCDVSQHEAEMAEQMEKEQFLVNFLRVHGITEEQYLQHRQQIHSELETAYAAHKAQENQQRQQQIIAEIQAVVLPNSECSMPSQGVPRLLKRADLVPLQKCTMWT